VAFRLPQLGELDFLPVQFRRTPSVRVFSADLSSATDLLSRELLEQIALYLGIDPILVTGGRIYFNGKSVSMTRGTLMGIPLSFPFLNLIHLYVCDKIGAGRNTYFICGDDLIAVWPLFLIKRYKRNLSLLTGMLLNDRKSFISLSRGIFCERAYHLTSKGLCVNRQFLSVKALTPQGKPTRVKGPEGRTDVPWEFSPLLYLSTHYNRLGHSRVHFAQTMALPAYVKEMTRLARIHRISMYVPIHLGGAGLFPPKRGWRLTPLESTWFQHLCDGDRVASSRLRLIHMGGVHSVSRSSQRMVGISHALVYTSTGEGLDDISNGLLAIVREYCDDVAAAEGHPAPEDVPAKVWFRALSRYPTSGTSTNMGEPQDSYPMTRSLRTFNDVREMTLSVDTSKTSLSLLLHRIAGLLPIRTKVETLANELAAEFDRSDWDGAEFNC